MSLNGLRFGAIVTLLLVFTQTYGEERFGGPDAVNNTIRDDADQKDAFIDKRASQSWFDWKDQLQKDRGVSLGLDYTTSYLNSAEDGASEEAHAAGGIFRFYGSLDLVGRGTNNTGSLVWKIEHRHDLADVAPQAFGFDQGFVGLIEPPFSDEGSRVTNLYWKQHFAEGRVSLMAGYLDVTDYIDVFMLASPWTGFQNFAFSTGTTTVFVPNDATFGVAVGAMLTDQFYVIGGVANAYADPTDPLDGAGDFFSDSEHFSSVEFGWTRSQGRIYQDNAHITYWHVDESTAAGTPGGWGVAFQYVTHINDRWMPFIRGGYADEGGSLTEKSLSLGVAYNDVAGHDTIGFAINWSEPNENTFEPGLDNQIAAEVFYRIQLTKQIVITPDIQYIKDPALNPNESSLWIVGLRARLAL